MRKEVVWGQGLLSHTLPGCLPCLWASASRLGAWSFQTAHFLSLTFRLEQKRAPLCPDRGSGQAGACDERLPEHRAAPGRPAAPLGVCAGVGKVPGGRGWAQATFGSPTALSAALRTACSYLHLGFSLFSFCHKTELYHTSPKRVKWHFSFLSL